MLRPLGDIVVDASRWPLLVFNFPRVFTDRDLDDVCRDCDRLLERGEPCLAVRDLRLLSEMPTATQRRTFAAWQESRREIYARRVVGLVNVSRSAIVRGMVKATHWITHPPSPEVMVPTMDEALRWGAARFEDRGLPVPAVLRPTP